MSSASGGNAPAASTSTANAANGGGDLLSDFDALSSTERAKLSDEQVRRRTVAR